MNIHGFNGQTMDINLTGNTPHHACIFSLSPLLLSKSTAGFRQISIPEGVISRWYGNEQVFARQA